MFRSQYFSVLLTFVNIVFVRRTGEYLFYNCKQIYKQKFEFKTTYLFFYSPFAAGVFTQIKKLSYLYGVHCMSCLCKVLFLEIEKHLFHVCLDLKIIGSYQFSKVFPIQCQDTTISTLFFYYIFIFYKGNFYTHLKFIQALGKERVYFCTKLYCSLIFKYFPANID